MKKSNLIQSFFEFTLSEIKGIGIFMMLIGMISVYQHYPIFHKFPKAVEVHLLESIEKQEVESNISKTKTAEYIWKLRSFNPNKTKAVDFKAMGFSNQFISSFFQYRSQRGYIKTKEEFLNIGDLSSEEQHQIQPFINLAWKHDSIPKEPFKGQGNEVKAKPKSEIVQPFDINLVDAVQLQTVKGIGAVLAKRIIKFRDRLGGFYHKNQLYEVYGLDSLVVENILKYSIDLYPINKLKINHLNLELLAYHPYIDYGSAKKIVAYREQHGPFNQKNDLLNIYGIDQKWLDRIEPYLDYE